MLKVYVKATDLLERLRSDKDGVVSFEYVIVAACIVAAVGLAFGTGSSALSRPRCRTQSPRLPANFPPQVVRGVDETS